MLKLKEKEKHKVTCKECLLKYGAIINLFPLKSKSKKSILTESAKLNQNKSALKDCTNILYNNNINKQYQKTSGVNFANMKVETPKGLQKKATQVQKKREKRNQARALVSNMERLWNENTSDR